MSMVVAVSMVVVVVVTVSRVTWVVVVGACRGEYQLVRDWLMVDGCS